MLEMPIALKRDVAPKIDAKVSEDDAEIQIVVAVESEIVKRMMINY